MNISPDFLYEREKLKEKLKKWKWLFCILLAILLLVITQDRSNIKSSSEEIARIRLEDVLLQDPDLIKKIKELEDNPRIKALIVNINSPGGVSYAGEELYVALRNFSKKKPTVSVLESVAASGGYMAALGTDYIVARNMTITGSIGVIWQSFEAVELANKLGIKFVNVKSSPLKASPNPMELTTKASLKASEETVQDSYEIFLQIFMESRKIEESKARELANGRVFIGKRAKELNLIDKIGGESEALMWLQMEKKISNKAKIIDIFWGKQDGFLKELAKFFNNANTMLNQGLSGFNIMTIKQ